MSVKSPNTVTSETAVEFYSAPVEGFGVVPNWLVRESTISAYGLLAYVALSGRTNRSGECWPSISTLAKEARCSESTARRAVRELEDVGLVTVARRRKDDGAQTSNIYRVHLDARSLSPLSVRQPPAVPVTVPPLHSDTQRRHSEEDTGEEDTSLNLIDDEGSVKPTPRSGRSRFAHRDDLLATPGQVTFLKDLHILVHQEVPLADSMAEYVQMSRAYAHQTIREYWAEIAGPLASGDADLDLVIESFSQYLSPNAHRFIQRELADHAA